MRRRRAPGASGRVTSVSASRSRTARAVISRRRSPGPARSSVPRLAQEPPGGELPQLVEDQRLALAFGHALERAGAVVRDSRTPPAPWPARLRKPALPRSRRVSQSQRSKASRRRTIVPPCRPPGRRRGRARTRSPPRGSRRRRAARGSRAARGRSAACRSAPARRRTGSPAGTKLRVHRVDVERVGLARGQRDARPVGFAQRFPERLALGDPARDVRARRRRAGRQVVLPAVVLAHGEQVVAEREVLGVPGIRQVAVGLHRGEDRRERGRRHGEPLSPAARGRPSQRAIAATTVPNGMPSSPPKASRARADQGMDVPGRGLGLAERRGQAAKPAALQAKLRGVRQRRGRRRQAQGEGRPLAQERVQRARNWCARRASRSAGVPPRPRSAIVARGQAACLARTARANTQASGASVVIEARRRLAHLGEQRLGAELVLGEDHLHLAVGGQGRVLADFLRLRGGLAGRRRGRAIFSRRWKGKTL